MSYFISWKEVSEILNCKKSHAYQVIRELNKELEEKGYMIEKGKVPSKYFFERFNLKDQSDIDD